MYNDEHHGEGKTLVFLGIFTTNDFGHFVQNRL